MVTGDWRCRLSLGRLCGVGLKRTAEILLGIRINPIGFGYDYFALSAQVIRESNEQAVPGTAVAALRTTRNIELRETNLSMQKERILSIPSARFISITVACILVVRNPARGLPGGVNAHRVQVAFRAPVLKLASGMQRGNPNHAFTFSGLRRACQAGEIPACDPDRAETGRSPRGMLRCNPPSSAP